MSRKPKQTKMRKLLIMSVVILLATVSQSQEVNRTFGVGLQSSFPTYGISAKYAIAEQSVIQGTVAPFGSGLFSVNFYGGGLELIVARKIGISAELGYGKMNVIDGIGVAGILAGGGIHFYIF
jgi:hypothetical protein